MFACFLDCSIPLLHISRKLGMVIPLLSAAFLLVHNVAAQNPGESQEHASLGISLARDGKRPEAEQESREAVRSAPGSLMLRIQSCFFAASTSLTCRRLCVNTAAPFPR
jgi:hypothetical protein